MAWQSFDVRCHQAGPIHVRKDIDGGEKRVTWRTSSGHPGLGDHQMADLVYADRWPLPARVVLTEGEKAADAVRAAGLDAVGTVCGAGSTPGDAVLDLFTGCIVTLWPDADSAGFDHMSRIAIGLERRVKALRLVRAPADPPSGWDAADASAELIRVLVRDAHDVWLRR